jgi:hypothetical protein
MNKLAAVNRSIIILLAVSIFLLACNRIKEGRDKLKDVPEKVKGKASELKDEILPTFDAHQPDTKANKKRFSDFLKVELTPDIKNIYCYGDAIGIDASYQFSFDCDTATVSRIISINQLSLDTLGRNDGSGISREFEWWNMQTISRLQLYSWNKGSYFKNFWYDEAEGKAYFLDYDM